jgi:hypothetical protein
MLVFQQLCHTVYPPQIVLYCTNIASAIGLLVPAQAGRRAFSKPTIFCSFPLEKLVSCRIAA